MRLRHLELMNMRLFGEPRVAADFDSQKNITILLGNNGCGKTTVLDAIASLVDPYTSTFSGRHRGRTILDTDIHLTENGRLSPYLSLSADFIDTATNETISVVRNRRGLDAAQTSALTEMRSYALGLRNSILHEESVILPILAYYGTGRGQIKAPERRRNFQREYERWDCYTNAMTPNTEFKRFQAWFDTMEDEERRQQGVLQDFSYKLPVLECVRRAVEQLVGEKYRNPRTEIHPLRFVLDEIDGDGNTLREMRLTQFSDGYKIITAMVADIASRMAEANPGMEDPLQSPGIVLIDEIDLHLHPSWQRTILRSLKEVFPNVQFIVTTHSPVVVIGAINIAQVLHLDGNRIHNMPLDTYQDYDAGLLLLSELFGMDSIQRQEIELLQEEQLSLLQRRNLSEQQQRRLAELDRRLHNQPVAAMSVYADMLRTVLNS
ncbi:MAG: AAA family ATPase [Bacteroidales bacterium]|nr:AAA family ATPase [Bacteroidales bacterium]